MRSLLVGVGIAAIGCETRIDLGPLHPATHPGFRLALELDDDIIRRAEPQIGFMHRGAEKLFEVRDYPAILALANRHDWLGAFTGELGAAQVVEQLMGVSVPPRARALRLVLAELTRLSSHLAFATGAPGATAAECWQLREQVQRLMLAASGSHLHPMITTIGGLRVDPGNEWLIDVSTTVQGMATALDQLRDTVGGGLDLARGLAILTAADAADFGVSGINARAAGSIMDARRADADYLELGAALQPRIAASGDAAARFALLLSEIADAPGLISACADRARQLQGPVGIRLPKVIRVPEGLAVHVTETPLGATTWLLDSTGDKVPNRLKIKAPSFATLAALTRALPGTPLPELGLALRSFVFLAGDADR